MAKEQFAYPASEQLFKQLEHLSQRSGVSRAAAFEDWLTAMVCALAAETKEGEYLAMVERHKAGKAGRRGVDLMGQMFGQLVTAMSETDADVLGDLFQGSITYGEAGQYFTPEAVTKLLAQLSIDPDARPENGKPLLVNDPCCGTGRMLLEASNVNPYVELVGQDIDARCTKITAINLGLRGRYGWIVCGNSLSGETKFAYRVGSFYHESPAGRRRGVIRDVAPEETPVPVLATRTRRQVSDLLAEHSPEPPKSSATGPIIEVPPWLARLEPRLVALDRDGGATDDGTPKVSESGRRDDPPEAGPSVQQTLF
ncbi:MAG: N-6 DNA methylase [Planctomycetales bacterium]|nr:N-6 DNA methylase [Planctomycetales bacterium]MBN8626651.1 N-6 DNA methylase [Planctomycetota bacterium]